MAKYPIVKVSSIEEVKNHVCVRVNNFRVCYCIFEYSCPKCKQVIQKQSIGGAIFELEHNCLGHCCKKKIKYDNGNRKTITRVNLGEKEHGFSKRFIGDIGESEVARILSRRYIIYKGAIGNERHTDLIVGNRNLSKLARIQVKASCFNHNNYSSTQSYCFLNDANKGEFNFDFLVGYLENYATFWIIPKDELIHNFKYKKSYHHDKEGIRFQVNLTHLDRPTSRTYKYINAWHYIDEFLA